MNINRLWTFGSIVIIIVIVASGWFLGISPRLEEAATANDQLSAVEATNAIHEATLVGLREQDSKLTELQKQLVDLQLSLPSELELDALIGQLHEMAVQSGVTVIGVSVGDPIAFLPEEAEALSAIALPEVVAAQSSVTTDNFFAIPLQVKVGGAYANTVAFLAMLQEGQRLYLATGVALDEGALYTTGDVFGTVEITVDGQIYVLRNSPVAAPPVDGTATVEAAPGGSETPQ